MKTKNICAGLLTGIMLLGSSMVSANPPNTRADSATEAAHERTTWEKIGPTIMNKIMNGQNRPPSQYIQPRCPGGSKIPRLPQYGCIRYNPPSRH